MRKPIKTLKLELQEQIEEFFNSFRVSIEKSVNPIEVTKIQINTKDTLEEGRLTLVCDIMLAFELPKIEIKRSGKGLKIELFKDNKNE